MDKTPEIEVFGDLPETYERASENAGTDDPREWARFLAKSIDFSLSQILTIAALILVSFGYGILFVGLLGWPYDESFFESPLFFGLYLLGHTIIFVLAEAFCISVFGGTPGKTLMGIRVRSVVGRRLGLGTSLKRSFWSVMAGLAFGIPILSLVAQVYQYNQLTKNGHVSWDRIDGLQYLTRSVAGWRWTLAIVLFVVIRIMEASAQYL